MKILDDARRNFDKELRSFARTRIIRKLKEEDLDYHAIDFKEFERLVDSEVKLLESDAKKVGLGIGVGFALSMLLGF
jgi:ribose 1,5-bisphosphokinase PhnN